MPALSKKQREAMAIAEHHPEKLHKENKGMLNMSKSQLHAFAATKEKNLPEHKRGSSSDSHHKEMRHKHGRGSQKA